MKKNIASILICLFAFILFSACTAQNAVETGAKTQEPSAAAPAASGAQTKTASAEPSVSASPSPSGTLSASSEPSYAAKAVLKEYKDSKAGFDIQYPEGWEIEKCEGELVRFTGTIQKTGNPGVIAVSRIKKAYSDLTKFDAYARELVESKEKDVSVKDLQCSYYGTKSGIQGRLALFSYKIEDVTYFYYYFFVPDKKATYMICCQSKAEDYNSVMSTYASVMASIKI